MESSINKLIEVLRQVQLSLRGVKEPWLVGGSCGLLLHGVPLHAAPRDLDLYTDSLGATEIHKVLLPYSIDHQIEDQSGIYKSILSHYEINGIHVELVGEFEVTALGSIYKVEAAFLAEAPSLEIGEVLLNNQDAEALIPALNVMPLEHELLFNVLRNRPDRYEAIAVVLRNRNAELTPIMRELIERNSLDDAVIAQLKELL
ncbi:hypothetical protein GC093_30725 [Paenibacillus sp. LMG 31456]|uniref:Uncharacterized protein n=1 Tax=Paenibacillus foliorum TaxID=2654974 RepID=A0A972K5Y9_9BACL|nr:hypothetical protein [Paenibacillus foliorum]NOU97567.1 hypothetical protein [Paenibacillus foliorum]